MYLYNIYSEFPNPETLTEFSYSENTCLNLNLDTSIFLKNHSLSNFLMKRVVRIINITLIQHLVYNVYIKI